ncbi:hypothetical protein TNIN_85111 [Trichonephila inaurata madagascariensis]|uniref:Histone H2A/H2B/H3 domain-containing protein n=1 Tax=Trichonephila inaurata madagascariensis TaxID=2747483 RepID=A0A8X6IYR3_9ARAC|nr:hypothetical protein TNIN_85111 [Trichonephila inaurata madagascariensis]
MHEHKLKRKHTSKRELPYKSFQSLIERILDLVLANERGISEEGISVLYSLMQNLFFKLASHSVDSSAVTENRPLSVADARKIIYKTFPKELAIIADFESSRRVKENMKL